MLRSTVVAWQSVIIFAPGYVSPIVASPENLLFIYLCVLFLAGHLTSHVRNVKKKNRTQIFCRNEKMACIFAKK